MTVVISKGDKNVSVSRNLRMLIRYAGKHKVIRVEVERLTPDKHNAMSANAELRIEFADGATCRTNFASFEICKDFVRARMNKWASIEDKKPVFRVITNEPEALGQIIEYEYWIYESL
jgi:ribosomal protein S3AE